LSEKEINWLGERPTCVVMCGGKSTRFGSTGHKSSTEVLHYPLIYHVIEYWRTFTDNFIFVVKHGKDELVEFITTLPIQSRFIEPDRLGGIAHGLSFTEPAIDGPFIVVLGDCFCSGVFDFGQPFDNGIGVIKSDPDRIRQNYSVYCTEDRWITRVIEKPQVVDTDLCGTGFYFFQPEIFDHIRDTRPSQRSGELEITDVLQNMLNKGVKLRAAMMDGIYINVTRPPDLALVQAELQGNSVLQDKG